uniref:Reverse transcriptase domain-containing protein n=1 Tax=Rhizophagus irregularis (strain DAOM 181602 / DAOM 197198 / MUCL 43194) TaxID=747089 RepID=U9TF91_RHIID
MISSLQSLGFTINEEKSSLIPSQVVDYLGFQIDSKTMMIKLPKHKIKDLIQECKKISQKPVILIRKLVSLIGTVFPVRLHSRVLLKDKNIGLKMQGWNGIIELFPESIAQLEW